MSPRFSWNTHNASSPNHNATRNLLPAPVDQIVAHGYMVYGSRIIYPAHNTDRCRKNKYLELPYIKILGMTVWEWNDVYVALIES